MATKRVPHLKKNPRAAEMLQWSWCVVKSVRITCHLRLDKFLKFRFQRSDKHFNGDEKSEPGSGVSGQVFREEQMLFAGSEDDASRAQQAKGINRRPIGKCRRLPESLQPYGDI
jgi:hypothetical protein